MSFYEYAQSLVPRYQHIHRCNWPRWLWLYRERPQQFEYLAALFAQFPASLQSDLQSRFFDSDEAQHLGAWFEILLSGWLSRVGRVSFPARKENQSTPDMEVILDDATHITFEAFVILPPPEVRRFERKFCRLWAVLRQIQRPYIMTIKNVKFEAAINWSAFKAHVERAIDSHASSHFHLRLNEGGVSLIAEARYDQDRENLSLIFGRTMDIRPDPIMRRIREKVKQHRQIRGQAPFVIAVLIAREDVTDEEMVRAVLGNSSVVIDTRTLQAIEHTIDYSGVFFHRQGGKVQIQNTSISGLLGFELSHLKDEAPYLQGVYVQNPFAKHFIEPDIWPVYRRYVVLAESEENFQMGWR